MGALVTIGLVLVAGALVMVGVTVAHNRVLRSHQGMPRAEFIALYVARGISPEVSGAVYDLCSKLGSVEGFEPHPHDTFAGTYLVEDDDLFDELKAILSHLGCDEEPTTVGPYGIHWPGEHGSVDEAVTWIDLVLKDANSEEARTLLLRSEPLGLISETYREASRAKAP